MSSGLTSTVNSRKGLPLPPRLLMVPGLLLPSVLPLPSVLSLPSVFPLPSGLQLPACLPLLSCLLMVAWLPLPETSAPSSPRAFRTASTILSNCSKDKIDGVPPPIYKVSVPWQDLISSDLRAASRQSASTKSPTVTLSCLSSLSASRVRFPVKPGMTFVLPSSPVPICSVPLMRFPA